MARPLDDRLRTVMRRNASDVVWGEPSVITSRSVARVWGGVAISRVHHVLNRMRAFFLWGQI